MAKERPLYLSDSKKLDSHKAIQNEDTKEICCVTNTNYTLVQHREMINQVVNTLSALNLECYGSVVNMGSKVYVNVLFPKMKVNDDAKGIHLGVRFTNSFDLTTGVNFSMYGMRIACDNQMLLKNLLFAERRKHVGEIDLNEMTRTFLEGAVTQVKEFEILVNDCIKDSVEWKLLMQFLEQNVLGKKHHNEIVARINDTLKAEGRRKPTRWDLYNAFTHYLSHDTLLKDGIIDYMEKKAAMVLAEPLENFVDQTIELKVEAQ
ncbi:MAG: DUF932 domain-containing protein [Candidatus Paceibacterota bacterium]